MMLITAAAACEPLVAVNLIQHHREGPSFYLTSCDPDLANLNDHNCSQIDSFLRYEIGFYLSLNCGLIQASANGTNQTYLGTLVHRSILYGDCQNCDDLVACINQTLMRPTASCHNAQIRIRNINIGLLTVGITVALIILFTCLYGHRCQKWILRRRCCGCCYTIIQTDPLIIDEEESF